MRMPKLGLLLFCFTYTTNKHHLRVYHDFDAFCNTSVTRLDNMLNHLDISTFNIALYMQELTLLCDNVNRHIQRLGKDSYAIKPNHAGSFKHFLHKISKIYHINYHLKKYQALFAITGIAILVMFGLDLWIFILTREYYSYTNPLSPSRTPTISDTHHMSVTPSLRYSNTLSHILTFSISNMLSMTASKTYPSKSNTQTSTFFIEYECYGAFQYIANVSNLTEHGTAYQCYLDNRKDISDMQDKCNTTEVAIVKKNTVGVCNNGDLICFNATHHCYNAYSYADVTCQVTTGSNHCDNLDAYNITGITGATPSQAVQVGNYVDKLIIQKPYICFVYNMTITLFITTYQAMPQRYCYYFTQVKPMSIIEAMGTLTHTYNYYKQYRINEEVIYCYYKAIDPLCGSVMTINNSSLLGNVLMSYNTYEDLTWRVGRDGSVIQNTQMPQSFVLDNMTELYAPFGNAPCISQINC